jgi:hypothetical protein
MSFIVICKYRILWISQQDNFQTYANTNLGFTIKHPPNWTVDESSIAIRNEVVFAPPDKGGIVGVMIENLTRRGSTH